MRHHIYLTQSIYNANIKDELIDKKGGSAFLYDYVNQIDIGVTCATSTLEMIKFNSPCVIFLHFL